MAFKISKYSVATAIAILFHSIGLWGILFCDQAFFIGSTVFNLLLMLGLLIWTEQQKNKWFLLFFLFSYLTGLCAEMIGVNTAAFFGHYQYGTVLGPGPEHTPLIIGVNWFTVIYGCGLTMGRIGKILFPVHNRSNRPAVRIPRALGMIAGGAALALVYDWIMEPVAVKLGYWRWLENGSIPLYNYVCWFVLSCLLLCAFYASKFEKSNKFAVNLMVVQLLFFLLLRIFLS